MGVEELLAKSDRIEEIEELLKRIDDINAASDDFNGKTPLIWAASQGHAQIVSALLQHPRINPDIQKEKGVTALMVAAYNGHAQAVTALLQHLRINPDVQKEDGVTALMCAAYKGHEQTVSALLQHPRINPDIQREDGDTALMVAAYKGHAQIVSALLQHPRINPDIQKEKGVTALMCAAHKGHEQTVSALLQHPRINPDIQREDGVTALMVVAYNGHAQAVSALLQHPRINPDIQREDGVTALMCAAHKGHAQTVTALLQHPRINPDIQNKGVATALNKIISIIKDNLKSTATVNKASGGLYEAIHGRNPVMFFNQNVPKEINIEIAALTASPGVHTNAQARKIAAASYKSISEQHLNSESLCTIVALTKLGRADDADVQALIHTSAAEALNKLGISMEDIKQRQRKLQCSFFKNHPGITATITSMGIAAIGVGLYYADKSTCRMM